MSRMLTRSQMLAVALVFISSAAFAQYKLTNLDSNQVGQAVNPPDPLIVNAWGLARAGTSSWWVSDEGSGWSTLYNGAGKKQPLDVEIPPAAGGQIGTPTGIVFNPSTSNEFQVDHWQSLFIFATLDGTISGWSFLTKTPNDAIIAVDNSGSGASYTGLAITNRASGNILYAADNAHNKIDMFNSVSGKFHFLSSFTDSTLPEHFSVFGIRDINGLVYATFADSTGGSGGFVDVFSENGVLLGSAAQGAPLNQPWGLAAAPKNFGPLSNTLLVSNNTNHGTINAFDPLTQKFIGRVKDTSGNDIVIDQLWGIDFGGGAAGGANGGTGELFFTAGPDNNFAGTFGKIDFVH